MGKEVCTISIGDGVLDDDYTFYEDGSIKRFYDQNMFKYNLEEWVDIKYLSEHKKKKLIDKCPDEHKEKIKQILNEEGIA